MNFNVATQKGGRFVLDVPSSTIKAVLAVSKLSILLCIRRAEAFIDVTKSSATRTSEEYRCHQNYMGHLSVSYT